MAAQRQRAEAAEAQLALLEQVYAPFHSPVSTSGSPIGSPTPRGPGVLASGPGSPASPAPEVAAPSFAVGESPIHDVLPPASEREAVPLELHTSMLGQLEAVQQQQLAEHRGVLAAAAERVAALEQQLAASREMLTSVSAGAPGGSVPIAQLQETEVRCQQQLEQLKALHGRQLEKHKQETAVVEERIAELESQSMANGGVPLAQLQEAEARHQRQLDELRADHARQLAARRSAGANDGRAAEELEQAYRAEQREQLRASHGPPLQARSPRGRLERLEARRSRRVRSAATLTSPRELMTPSGAGSAGTSETSDGFSEGRSSPEPLGLEPLGPTASMLTSSREMLMSSWEMSPSPYGFSPDARWGGGGEAEAPAQAPPPFAAGASPIHGGASPSAGAANISKADLVTLVLSPGADADASVDSVLSHRALSGHSVGTSRADRWAARQVVRQIRNIAACFQLWRQNAAERGVVLTARRVLATARSLELARRWFVTWRHHTLAFNHTRRAAALQSVRRRRRADLAALFDAWQRLAPLQLRRRYMLLSVQVGAHQSACSPVRLHSPPLSSTARLQRSTCPPAPCVAPQPRLWSVQGHRQSGLLRAVVGLATGR
jgi:hypothetical protein